MSASTEASNPDLVPADTRRFRATREAEWRRLELLLGRAQRNGVDALSDEDLLALPILYRGALSSLSVARETSLDLEIVTWLEALCARAYFFVYGVRTRPLRRMATFFIHDWPDAVRRLWKETLASLVLTLVGLAAGFLLVASDPAWYNELMPSGLAQGRDFSASTEALRTTLYDDGSNWLGLFATYLFTHNSQVAVLCFALGFAFAVPTALLLVYNGTMLGAILALFTERGLGTEMGGWLIIHGSTEFFAIVLAGAAGMRIGWSVVFPGASSRLDSAARAGRTAAMAMGGVVVMLLVAGMLEGVGRQIVTQDALRYGIGIAMLILWLGYFYAGRRRHG